MQDPTILDYVKQRLRFWQKRTLRLRDFPPIGSEEGISQPVGDLAGSIPLGSSSVESVKVLKPLPWRMLLGLSLAFMAQALLEPPALHKTASLVFYMAAIGMTIWSAICEGWFEFPREPLSSDMLQPVNNIVRWQPVLAALLLAAVAYFSFSTYHFDFLNICLWIGAILLYILGFIDLDPIYKKISGLKRVIKEGFWQVRLSPWLLVGLAAAGIIIYLRAAHLVSVPPEMTSDHAEKLQDVQDVLNGQWHVFFTRNTGREAFQFYWTALVIKIFGTGISFLSLKIGTVLAGLIALPYIYLLGKEFTGKRAGFIAAFFAGIAYWPNVISRVALRFAFYPLFAAPALYHLMRGLKRGNRNDFIWAGVFIGLGLHGYSPYRVVPILALLITLIYILHHRSKTDTEMAITGLTVTGLLATIVSIPLIRYAMDNPDSFFYRLSTRVGDLERPIPGNPWLIFFDNFKNSMLMFGVSDGSAWLHSIPFRPALDVISAAILYLGFALLIYRYIRQRNWADIVWLISVPVLMLPSILSLAFPEENPALNRSAGALIPVFLIIGLVVDGVVRVIKRFVNGRKADFLAGALILLMVVISTRQNYHLVFEEYQAVYRAAAGNTTEMGQVIHGFIDSNGSADSAWVVGYPYWVDTRLVSIEAGVPIRDYAIWPGQFEDTRSAEFPLLFILNMQDDADLAELRSMYPQAIESVYQSQTAGRDFRIFLVPDNE
jgi:hypothetical protein